MDWIGLRSIKMANQKHVIINLERRNRVVQVWIRLLQRTPPTKFLVGSHLFSGLYILTNLKFIYRKINYIF